MALFPHAMEFIMIHHPNFLMKRFGLLSDRKANLSAIVHPSLVLLRSKRFSQDIHADWKGAKEKCLIPVGHNPLV